MKGKQITIGENLKQKVFYNNLSIYLKLINNYLSKKFNPEKLEKHIKILGGYAFRSSQYQKEGIPIIRISDFQNEKIDLSSAKYYEEKPEYDRYQLFEGDIILAMTGGTIGKLGIVQKGLGKLYLNQRVGKFQILKSEEFFDRYIYWLARGIQERVKDIGYGGAQPNISGKQIEEMEFPIPNKSIQKRIVDFLECLKDNCLKDSEYFDKKTEKEILRLQEIGESLFYVLENSQNDKSLLTKLKQSILQEAVQGKLIPQDLKDEPAKELLKKIKKEKEKLIKEGKIKKGKELPAIEEDEIPYELPEGWVWCRLGDLGETQTGTTPSTNNSNYFNGNIPFIKPADISKNGINYFNESLTEEGLNHGRLIPKDSLMMVCIGGSTGKSFFTDRDCSCNQQINTLKGSMGITGKFLFYFTSSTYFQDSVWNLSTGSATNIINKQKWASIPFPLPPLPEQKRIVAKVDELMKSCDELEEQVKKNKKSSELLMSAVLRESFEDDTKISNILIPV